VDGVTASVYKIPTDQPEGDGTLAWSATTLIVAHVSAGGRTGLGYTYAASACKPLIEGELATAVTGHNVLDTGAAWQAMVRAVRNLGRPGLVSCAISAVDTALWDLKATLLGLPVSRLARQVIGPDAELYVDANGGYTRKQAVRMALAMAEQDVTWFEEPVSSDDLDGLREVRDQVTADVTAGEYGYDLVYFARMVDAGAVDCLQADVTRCGGITEWQRAAAVAAARGLQVSGHCAPNLHAHVAAAVPNLRHLEYFHDHARIESRLFDGALDPSGGALRPDPARPGLALKEPDAAPFRVA